MAHLHFRCTSCDQALRARPGMAGRKVQCPGCGALMPVPATTSGQRRPPDPSPSDRVPARPTRTRSEETAAQAPPEADDPAPRSSPQVRRRRRLPSVGGVNGDPRYDRRNYPGWRKVRVGLLLLLIALVVPLARPVLFYQGIGFPGLSLLLFGLQVLPSTGYLLCTFVPVAGWPKRLAIANLALAVLLLAWQAFTMLSLAHASDPRKIERDMAKVQEQIQADSKAREEKIKEALKDPNNRDALKQLLDKEIQEMSERTTKQTNWFLLWLRVDLILRSLLWCLQVVLLACFLRGVAHFFKAYDLDNSCLVLIMVALVYVILQIPGSLVASQGWRPGQSEPRFLNPYSLNCFLLPLLLICQLLQLRLLVRIRRVVDDYLP